MAKKGGSMSVRLLIPRTVPAVERRAILDRIRREQRDLEDVMDDARASAVTPLQGWRQMIARMRGLNALEQAWMDVHLGGVS